MTFIEINEYLGTNWPPKRIAKRWGAIEEYRGLYDNNIYAIESQSSRYRIGNQDLTVPLAKVLARTSANLLFAEEMSTVVNTENEPFIKRMEEIKTENKLQSISKEAAESASVDGGCYGISFLDPTKKKGQRVPLITFVSETQVIPKFDADGELEAAIVIKTFKRENNTYYRLLETYSPGRVDYELFMGSSRNQLGKKIDLADFSDTEEMPDYVEYPGLDELTIEYIPNIKNLSSHFGRSDFEGLEPLLLGLDETFELTQEVLRTMVPHIFIEEDLLDEDNSFAPGSNVIPVAKLDSKEGDKPVIEATQHRFESQEYIAWQRHLLEITLLSVGTSPAALGLDVDGGLASGTALKLKMNNTLNQIAGKAQFFESAIAKLLRVSMIIDQLDVGNDEYFKPGFTYEVDPATVSFAVSLGDGINDDIPNMNEIAAAFQAGIISRYEAIKMQHKDWTEEQINAEVARIETGLETTGAAGLVSGLVL